MVTIRMAYDDHDTYSAVTGLACKDKSLTQQSFAEECDINTIVKRFGLTGALPATGSVPLVTNGDFVPVLSYQEALAIIKQGEESFNKMPAEVRSRFDNDASKFVDFCSDVEANRGELERLGLAVPKAKVESPAVPKA